MTVGTATEHTSLLPEAKVPRTYIKVEYFQWIELRGSITIDEFAAKFGIPRKHAAVWLSKWAGKGYLTLLPRKQKFILAGERGRPKSGGYKLGPKWWGEMVYGRGIESL